MSEIDTAADGQALQFDRVVTESAPASDASNPTVDCWSCRTQIEREYYQVNGNAVCDRCRAEMMSAAETPRGMVPFAKAGMYGLGAGLVGAAIYYGVIVLTNLEIGIVAILIGYMVGYAIRKAARGRGGRRFQILAAALTYASVAFAYTPIAVQAALEAEKKNAQQPATTTSATTPPEAATPLAGTPESPEGAPDLGSALIGLAVLLGFVAALPVLVVAGSMPSGLISAFIIFIGMRQAWTMTGTPALQMSGPYRVGFDPSPQRFDPHAL